MPQPQAKPIPLRCWYLLANGSRAQAYVKRAEDSGYDQVRIWDAPEARMKDSELGEDKPGRAFAAGVTWDACVARWREVLALASRA